MIALKKLYGDELLRLALVLSLLKADPNEYLENETQLMAGLHISNGTDWSEQEARTLVRPRFVHPKSLDNILINYERELFEELNSLGRYNSHNSEYNARMWNRNRPILHTYLVNNVATDSVAPPLAEPTVNENDVSTTESDGVSADDNVAQEIKVTDEESQPEAEPAPDAVVTLSADFLENRTESDIFAEIATRSFDVNEFLVTPEAMHIKKEKDDDDLLDVNVKKERDAEDLYDDNAIDDFVPYFTAKAEKFEIGEPHSVFDQNIADLQDYNEFLDDVKELRNNFDYLDVKHQQENLEQYLLENTPLDLEADEVYDLAPMFDEELVLNVKRERPSTSFTSASSSGVSEMELASVDDASNPDEQKRFKIEPDEGHHTGDELTQEDMDLIEVLWKQDVDMGFCLDNPLPSAPQLKTAEDEKELKADEKDKFRIEKVKADLLEVDQVTKEDDPWAGLSYTVDTETGEYILQGDLPGDLTSSSSRFQLLEEALQLVELGDDKDDEAIEGSSSGAMLHPAMSRHAMPPHHPLAHYHNQSLMRSMSVEQRWQDLASLLTIPPPPAQYPHYHPHHHHHHHHQHPHGVSHEAAGYAPNYAPVAPPPPGPDKHPDAYAGAAAPMDGAYKVESAHHPQQHDGIYYQNGPEPLAPTNSDGFLQSILNDEDLQLMDMAMNEGMYTMRVLDGGAASHHHAPPHNHTHMMMTSAERDSASDSAVSSMGSERVPSLSDGEWCDAGSDSAVDYHSSKFRPYDGAYGRDRAAGSHPQKKHHMFGKRCFQDQQQTPNLEPLTPAPRAHSVIKYECNEQAYAHNDSSMHLHNEFTPRLQPASSHPHMTPLQPPLDLNSAHSSHSLLQSNMPSPTPHRFVYGTPERVRHNHTYSAHELPPAVSDKRVRRMTDGSISDGGSTTSQHMSRDEKRAKALGMSIPLEVQDIINLPMDEFNERLSKHDLSEAQLSLIRDIRRRGKNKVAAQNCRKRKLDQITSLADEVRTVRDRKIHTQRDHQHLIAERQRVKETFAQLYRHVFQNLRDSAGRPLSSSQYSLQQAADGNVVLVPKMPHHTDQLMNRTSDDEMDRKPKSYDQ
ncbi:segmentation protein cap'n'collar isoform X3 [Plutella xylostella]|uniref:segmentation protein cap'n'collar isoform X3 n=1 Tax=Plutella xylostella TaxID=51655 RepID=UPI00203253F8|nr:segmentation protein cap'n'collar isoform X3 [Plutella xylostella]